MLKNKKILYLTLKKPQFAVTISGEKRVEYRMVGKWILSRLLNKNYDFIKFTNGYGNDKPYFICEFKGWEYTMSGVYKYSNGLVVNISDGDIEINLGNIITKKNLKNEI
jgi:hypothetical protein